MAFAPYVLHWSSTPSLDQGPPPNATRTPATASLPASFPSFLTVGGINIVCGVALGILFLRDRTRSRSWDVNSVLYPRWNRLEKLRAAGITFCQDKKKVCINVSLLALIFFFCFISAGSDESLSEFLFLYETDGSLNYNATEVYRFRADYRLSLSAARILASFLCIWFHVEVVLVIQLVWGLFAGVMLTAFAGNSTAFRLFSITYALFKGAVFPTSLGLVNKYFLITGKIMIIINAAAAIGLIAFESISSHLVDQFGPDVIISFPGAHVTALLILAAPILFLGDAKGARLTAIIQWRRRTYSYGAIMSSDS